MRSAACYLLVTIAFVISACGSFVAESPENSWTPVSGEASSTDTTSALLIWESAGSPCDTLAITSEGLSYGGCGETLIAVPEQITNHSARFLELSNLYIPFAAETPAGKVTLSGSGFLVPTEAEKRSIAEWARLMFQTAQSGRIGAAWGMAFSWQREAGPGDFCDGVVVYLSGWATASDCQGYSAQGYLTASQLDQVYTWVDTLTTIDHTETFPPATGGLKMTLALAGSGQQPADEETIRDIFEFAATLYTELGYAAQAGADVEEARLVLEEYLMALHSGDYARAAELYSGDISLLQSWNPDTGEDLAALLQRGCTQNGLQCLPPRTIRYRAPDSDGGYHFYVEFNNDDQTLFEQGPCCGEMGGTSVSVFPFLVEKSGSGLLVPDLPPYVP